MIDTYFAFNKVTNNDRQYWDLNAVVNSMKLWKIKAVPEDGTVEVPEMVDGIPVTFLVLEGLMDVPTTPIERLVLPKTLITIGGRLPMVEEELVIDKDNPKWCSDGVSLLSKDGTLLRQMCVKNKHSYVIPDGVKTIGYRAFKDIAIEELTIPDSVATIEQGAFDGCFSLREVHGGNNV